MAKFHEPSTASETALQEEIGGNHHAQPVATTMEVCGISHLFRSIKVDFGDLTRCLEIFTHIYDQIDLF